MEINIRFLGLELLSISASTDVAECVHEAPDESLGDCTTYPVGFIAYHDSPDEVGLPDRYPGE